jgi:hypothetical protein
MAEKRGLQRGYRGWLPLSIDSEIIFARDRVVLPFAPSCHSVQPCERSTNLTRGGDVVMTQASGGQRRPENRSELLYWKLRKKVWLIASGLTLFGALAVAPFVERPLRLVFWRRSSTCSSTRLSGQRSHTFGRGCRVQACRANCRYQTHETPMSSAPDNAARKRRDTIFCFGLAALLAVLFVGWKSLLIRGVPGDLDATALTIS